MQDVLVLDDSEDDRFFTSRAFKKSKPDAILHEFSYAKDALSFLRSPDRPTFDVLLVDINLPRMNGFEFAEAYLELYPELRGSAPIFIVSGTLNPDDRARAEAHAGITGFIEKPITAASIKRIEDILAKG